MTGGKLSADEVDEADETDEADGWERDQLDPLNPLMIQFSKRSRKDSQYAPIG
jgi:hypothetical protein